jgi:sugar phosphate isomerase/epimerase
MKLGIFAKTFPRPSVEETLDAVRAHHLTQVQFNLVCAGVPTLPDHIDQTLVTRIRRAFTERELEMAALSGTFNMIHPDLAERRRGLDRLRVLADAAPSLGTQLITLCTGTRDPSNMWAAHPANNSHEAWNDLLSSIETALTTTTISFGIEPEITNVVSTAAKARQLLNHFKTPRLKIVIDPANLFGKSELPRQRQIITEAFDLLAPDIALAHAKELRFDSAGISEDLLDYDCYLHNLRRIHYNGPLILHGLAESQVEDSLRFIRQKLSPAP